MIMVLFLINRKVAFMWRNIESLETNRRAHETRLAAQERVIVELLSKEESRGQSLRS